MSALAEYFDELIQENGWTYHGFTLADLEREAHSDEWAELKDNPLALEAFALALLESRQIAEGIRPERWTGTAHCRMCGVVYVAPFLDGKRNMPSCRWCAIREAGKTYPKPYPISRDPSIDLGCSTDCRPLAWQGDSERAIQEAAQERRAIMEENRVANAKAQARLAEEFYRHIFGPAQQTGCCYAPTGHYCREGKRLRDAYYEPVGISED